MFVSMVAGAVFVMIFGIIMMLVLYAGNLDTLLMVSPDVTDICCITFFVIYLKVHWGRLQCMFHPPLLIILLILTALVMSLVYLSVPLMVWLVIILVLTQEMLMLIVKV